MEIIRISLFKIKPTSKLPILCRIISLPMRTDKNKKKEIRELRTSSFTVCQNQTKRALLNWPKR